MAAVSDTDKRGASPYMRRRAFILRTYPFPSSYHSDMIRSPIVFVGKLLAGSVLGYNSCAGNLSGLSKTTPQKTGLISFIIGAFMVVIKQHQCISDITTAPASLLFCCATNR